MFLFLMISVNPVYSQCEMGILLKGGGGGKFLQSHNRSSARWRYFITTTRKLQGFAILCKLEFSLFKLRWDYQIYKNERSSNDVIV